LRQDSRSGGLDQALALKPSQTDLPGGTGRATQKQTFGKLLI
jgi:hypothetical protein